MTRRQWYDIAVASYGNQWVQPEVAKVCVVATRYGGLYEGGQFAAIPVNEVDGDAFGEDIPAAHWWDKHEATVGVGNSPDEALTDWFQKQQKGAA